MSHKMTATEFHDAHLLHLLEQFTTKIESLDLKDCTENQPRFDRCSFRVSAWVPDTFQPYSDSRGESVLQVGVAPVGKRMFGLRNPVLNFFCFYDHQPVGKPYPNDCLFNSSLYIFNQSWWGLRDPMACLKPFTPPWYRNFPYYPKHTDPDHNTQLDEALQRAVFKAIELTDKSEWVRKKTGIILDG